MKVFGATKIVKGEHLVVECESSASNPATTLTWSLHQDGLSRNLEGQTLLEYQENGSSITRSLLSVPVEAGSAHHLVVECYGQHPLLGADSLAFAHKVDILSPPGVPHISGGGVQVEEGSSQQLTCYTSAGNPPAQLQWYRGNQMMESRYRYFLKLSY